MKVKDVFEYPETDIFTVTNDAPENVLMWTIRPTNFKLIPDKEGNFLVKAKEIGEAKTIACYMFVVTPERTAEGVIRKNNGKVEIAEIYDTDNAVIPAMASECFGVYELYKSTGNVQVGIDILKEGLKLSGNKAVIAEDMGYILRDENRVNEAIEAFEISATSTPSSEFIYHELAQLYTLKGDLGKAKEYQDKFDAANFSMI